jgi:nicotinamidase/pyrazinamidase
MAEGAIFLRKGVGGEDGYSAFTLKDPVSCEESETGLAEQLRKAGIDTVVVVGLALDYCVKATLLDAARAGFSAVLLADGTLPVNLVVGDGARSVAELVSAGVAIV